LKEIHLPTLILPGEQDQIVPLEEAQLMQAAIPEARLQIIPRAGHLTNLENPIAFNMHVRQFIQFLQSAEQK
jgi:3-oxoadipate enol-lactonase